MTSFDDGDIQQVEDDLVALVKAWADRGIPPSQSCQILASTSHKMIVDFTDASFGALVALMAKQWEACGGRF